MTGYLANVHDWSHRYITTFLMAIIQVGYCAILSLAKCIEIIGLANYSFPSFSDPLFPRIIDGLHSLSHRHVECRQSSQTSGRGKQIHSTCLRSLRQRCQICGRYGVRFFLSFIGFKWNASLVKHPVTHWSLPVPTIYRYIYLPFHTQNSGHSNIWLCLCRFHFLYGILSSRLQHWQSGRTKRSLFRRTIGILLRNAGFGRTCAAHAGSILSR